MAEDLDVTAGSTTPFDRPQLGDWLNHRIGEFDVLVFYRMDRLVRRLLDLADVIRWCQEHSVLVVSATEQFLDLTAPFGDIIGLLVAKVAEMELAAISDRNRSAAQYNLRAGKYRGGIPPWGYLPEQTEDGWRYVQDPEQVSVINEVVQRTLKGEPLRAIAHDLTSRGVLTTKDRFAQSQGREIEGYEWHSAPLKRSLSSPTLLGHAVSEGKSIRNEDGSPVVRSEPILTPEVFDRLAVELAGRENRKEPTKRSSGLLLRVICCGVCGEPAYRLKGGAGRSPRYRCATAQYAAADAAKPVSTRRQKCGNKSIPLAYADETVQTLLLGMLGDSERLERLWDKGSDFSAELADIDNTLGDLTDQLGTGAFTRGTPQRGRLDARIAALAARQTELASEAVVPAGWTWQPTGEKFGDWWARQDVTGQNVWLRSMGIRLEFEYLPDDPSPSLRLDLGDLGTLTHQLNPSGPVAEWQKVFGGMGESGVQGMTINSDGSVALTP